MKIALLLTLIQLISVYKLTSQSTNIYDELLNRYVTTDGNVNYRGFITENKKFETILDHLSENPPEQNASREEKLAYWINTYNAFTIKLIVDNYPLESIKELHPFFYIPGFNTVWHEEFFHIGGEDFSLDHIEHEILRKEFDDVRIHFAINCASKSCPRLRNEVYKADQLNSQLDDQTRIFLSDSNKNKISNNELQVSKIFSWFKGDFASSGGVVQFIDDHTEIKVSSDAKISYLPYDWSLNE